MSSVKPGAALHSEPAEGRKPSLLDAACENFVFDMAKLSPSAATAWGIEGYEGELEDFSPAYYEAVAERQRDLYADVDFFDDCTDDSDDDDDFDDVDYVTAAVIRDRIGLDLELHHARENLRELNVIASPVQSIRDTFLLMPQETAENKEAIRSRLSKVATSLAGYRESLAEAASHREIAAQRQVDAVVAQCEDLAEDGSLLETLGVDGPEVDEAKRAFGEMAEWLQTQLSPHAPSEDGVGRERYERFSHLWVGERVDLDEAYKWGLDELNRIVAEQEGIAKELYGEGTSVRQAYRKLDADPRYLLEGREALVEWMQTTADRAIADLHGTAFDIPEQVRTVECKIDPAGSGGIFYMPPSEDFSRPGTMYWSVPEGQNTFHTWQELTTVFHEGVPGHHLQIGQAMVERENLNLWRRVACWNSGHGEGWALYAEGLMSELGYHEDPGTRMGYLDAQRLRAARVVLDIGVHLGKHIPEGSGVWDAAYAKSFLREHSAMDGANLAFELDRYLGWPGQAPSYALGQRMWQRLRDDAVAAGATPAQFHAEALKLGSIPMSILREQVIG